MRRKLPIFYSALLLTGVNLLLRLVSTSFQVQISARIGPEGVGLLQLVMSVGSLAMTAGMAGIRTTTMYLTAEELGHQHSENIHRILRGCFLYSILISGFLSLVVYSAAPWLAEHWVGNLRTLQSIRLFACFLPIVCLCGSMTGYFTAANRIGTLAIVEVFEQLCYMAVTMTALVFWAGTNPERACACVVAGSGLSAAFTLICLWILRLREKAPHGPRIPIARKLLNTAIPLALADDLKTGINTGENLMVPRRLALYTGSLSPLAAFGIVCGMVFPVMMFPAAILFSLAELLIPELARCNAAGSHPRVQYLAKRSLKIALLYGSLCGGILFLIARPLCLSLYDSPEAGTQLQRYSILVPMLYCDAIVDAMIKGLGQQKASVRYNILTSGMDLTLLYLLLPRYGMDGYFLSFLVTHLINFLLSIRRLLKITGIHIPFYLPILAAAGTLAGVFGASFVQNAPGRILAFLPLLGSLWVLFGILSRKDLRWLRGLWHHS